MPPFRLCLASKAKTAHSCVETLRASSGSLLEINCRHVFRGLFRTAPRDRCEILIVCSFPPPGLLVICPLSCAWSFLNGTVYQLALLAALALSPLCLLFGSSSSQISSALDSSLIFSSSLSLSHTHTHTLSFSFFVDVNVYRKAP